MSTSTTAGYADVLVGLQYGDEGKAKIIDLIADEYDIIARFNGGANAGHTIDTPQGRVVLQQVPSAVFHDHATLYIGSGCALNLWKLAAEIDLIEAAGVSLAGRLVISDRCAVVAPAHFVVDHLNSLEISTTLNGIGPCYADRANRVRAGERANWQLRDLVADTGGVVAAMGRAVEHVLDGIDDDGLRVTARERLESLPALVERMAPYVQSDLGYLRRRVAAGARVLFEGAQSIMLDVVHGDQPFVTASHTLPAHAYVGGDLPPSFHRRTIGVAKAIVSRVGNGPFPAELGGERSEQYFDAASREGKGRAYEVATFDPSTLLASQDPFDLGIALRMLTDEYGAGTGRPRRIGLLDLDQLRRTAADFGVDVLFLNKVDCLSLYGKSVYAGIPVLATVDPSASDPVVTVFPSFETADMLDPETGAVAPQIETLRSVVERAVGVRVAGFGLGPERERTVRFDAHGRAAALPADTTPGREVSGARV